MTSLVKEIKGWHRFSRHTSEKEKAIVFYAEHQGYYMYFEGLIEQLIHEHQQPVSYITSDLADPILRTSEPRLKSFYLNKLLPFFMALVNCQVFIMTLTDLNLFYLRRSVNPVKYVYLFHALSSTRGYRFGAFDHYDIIFCVGPHQVKEIRQQEELNRLPPKVLVKAGYYRLERIYQAYQKYCYSQPDALLKPAILLAPTWGANVLEDYGERIIELLLDHGYRAVVRPHPETIRRSPELLARLLAKFSDNPDFALDQALTGDDSLIQSEVLISDCYSGIALEYAFGTERPVLFLDAPIDSRKRYFNPRFKELNIEPMEDSIRPEIGITISLPELPAIPRVIADLRSKREIYRKRIVELREQNVFAFGHSSEIGARRILDIARDRDNQEQA